MSIGMQYQSTWESIKQHTTPSWFKKAKYGIYAHWGPYSVPAAGPNWNFIDTHFSISLAIIN